MSLILVRAFLIPLLGAQMNLVNHQFRLAARPVGLPKRTDWTYTEEPVADPGPGQLVIKILYLSLDPAMRGWMNDARSYIEPVKIGDVMRAGGVGRVVASAHWACRDSPPTSACSMLAKPRLVTPWLSPELPEPLARWWDRSPKSKDAAWLALPVVRKNEDTW